MVASVARSLDAGTRYTARADPAPWRGPCLPRWRSGRRPRPARATRGAHGHRRTHGHPPAPRAAHRSPRGGRCCRSDRAAAAAPHLPGARPPPSGAPAVPAGTKEVVRTCGGSGVPAPLETPPAARRPPPAARSRAGNLCSGSRGVRGSDSGSGSSSAAGAGPWRCKEQGRRLVPGAGSAPREPALLHGFEPPTPPTSPRPIPPTPHPAPSPHPACLLTWVLARLSPPHRHSGECQGV
jgi:hypothetical protein